MASELARHLRDIAWSEVAGLGLVADPTVTEINEAVKGAVAAALRELEAEAIRRGGDGVYWPFPGDLRTLADEIERDQ